MVHGLQGYDAYEVSFFGVYWLGGWLRGFEGDLMDGRV